MQYDLITREMVFIACRMERIGYIHGKVFWVTGRWLESKSIVLPHLSKSFAMLKDIHLNRKISMI